MNEQLKVIITAEIDKLKNNVNEAKKKIKDFIKEGTKDFDKFNEEFQKAGDASKKALTAIGVGVAAAGTALLALGSSTKEYREEQAKLATAFEAAGSTAEQAKSTYNDLYRVLGDSGQATEAANHLAKLTKNQKSLNQWTNICQGVYATFGDSLPIEGLTEAANETAKVGKLTGGLADALNWAGVNEENFQAQLDACATEAEREALIRETLNGLYSEAAGLYEENASGVLAQNEAQAQLDETMARIGETIAPINAALAELGAALLETIAPFIESFVSEHGESITAFLTSIAETVGAIINWIANNWELVSTIAIIIASISAALTVLSTVMGIVNAVMMASPVTWIVLAIVAAVAALVAIIVLCVQYWDEIKAAGAKAWEAIQAAWDVAAQFFIDLWDSIVDAVKAAWGWITNLFSTIGNWIYKNVIKPVADFFKGLWETIVKGFHTVIDPWVEIIKRASKMIYDNVIKPIADFFVGLWNSITSGLDAAWTKIKEVFSIVANWVNDTVIKPVANFFTGMWDGLTSGAKKAWDGIVSVFSVVSDWFTNVFKKAWEGVKNVFSVGGKIFSGIKDGIVSAFKAVVNAIITGINKVVAIPFNAINSALKTLKGLDILGVKPFGWISTISVPQIPKLARGGIVDSATMFIAGEAGKEAILPLENNTEWLTQIATMLSERLGNKTPVILNVDGKTFGEISISSINNITRATGSLPLVLA